MIAHIVYFLHNLGYTMCADILIIDDNINVSKSLSDNFDHFGLQCDSAQNGFDAVNAIMSNRYKLVLLDLKLGPENGIDILKKIKLLNEQLPVILITGFGTIDTAIEAIKSGAYDYIEKPINFDKLLSISNNAIEIYNLKIENQKLTSQIENSQLSSKSNKMMQVIENAIILAKSPLPILLLGESGSGKDVFAELIHNNSDRKNQPMEKVNSAAFPETLLDNELFGHEKDAYTGANSSFKGVFERAHNSTLFLDEIGDMPLSIQAKILRAIQNQEIRRIGGSDNIKINTRFITATNKNIEELMKKNLFREDLFYRLNSGILRIPPLREHPEDIPGLCKSFITEHCRQMSVDPKIVSQEVYEKFSNYYWPGNIRELKSTIMYALTISRSNRIEAADLPDYISANKPTAGKTFTSSDNSEKQEIISALQTARYNKTKAAELLNISRRTLYNKMEAYGIE